MNTITENKVLANGATFLKTVNGTSITSGSSVKASSKGQESTVPVAPESVSASFSKGVITVTMTVFIDSKATVNSLNVYKELGSSSVVNNKIITTKPIYVVYNYKEEIPEYLYPYTFNFTIADPDNTINRIESYLENIDPVTSSGTKTTVKRGM
jgi:hypothetical protein